MGEAKNNPVAQAKEEGRKSGFSKEIEDIAIIVKLAEIGLESLKLVDLTDKTNENVKIVETLLNVGPSVISKFSDTANYLYEKANQK